MSTPCHHGDTLYISILAETLRFLPASQRCMPARLQRVYSIESNLPMATLEQIVELDAEYFGRPIQPLSRRAERVRAFFFMTLRANATWISCGAGRECAGARASADCEDHSGAGGEADSRFEPLLHEYQGLLAEKLCSLFWIESRVLLDSGQRRSRGDQAGAAGWPRPWATRSAGWWRGGVVSRATFGALSLTGRTASQGL